MLADVWGHDRSSSAAYSPDGRQLIVDRVARWDVEWRCYRGGQNTPRQILASPHLTLRREVKLPKDRVLLQRQDIPPRTRLAR